MNLEDAKPVIILPRVERFEEAVKAGKTDEELLSLRLELCNEIMGEAGGSTDIGWYFDSRCDEIIESHRTPQ